MRCPYLAAMVCVIPMSAFAQSVSVWEGTITLPTYPIYGADVNPKFYELEKSFLYPYTMQDDLSDVKEDRTYKALFLENEYLKVICLPQIGGRIHSVLDKTTGEEMFHRNDVIKPGLIALRGAWISGGIEWNRGPQGHTVTSFGPVHVTPQKHADGSASLVIGETEMIFRTRWNVRLTLHPGRKFLHETIRLYNPTDGTHSYYFWNNTAFPCTPGTRFIYPMTLGQDHSGTAFFRWPVHNGKDITWLKNYDEPSSVFAYQCEYDFFGAYDVDRDYGIVQYGDHRVLTGKKAWTWGQSGDGIASQRALHDDDAQYIEVQSGPLQTQADYGLLGPREQIEWEEWWYPVHGLGDGFEFATKDVAIQTHRTGEPARQLEVRIASTSEFGRCTVAIAANGGAAQRQEATLSVLRPAVLLFNDPGAATTLTVTTGEGQVLATYSTPLQPPHRDPPAPASAPSEDPSADECYAQGVEHEKRIERVEARMAYERALAKDASHLDSLVALARLDLRAALYDDAIARLQQALTARPDAAAASLYLGIAYLGKRDYDAAISALGPALRSKEHASLSHDVAGRAWAGKGDYTRASDSFREALRLNPRDSETAARLVATLYAAGKTAEGEVLSDELIEEDPLHFPPRAVRAVYGTSADIRAFMDFVLGTSGSYQFEITQTTFFFMDLGMYPQAHMLLRAAYSQPIPNVYAPLYQGAFSDLRQRPLAWYLLGYLAHRLGYDSIANVYVNRGRAIETHYGFPSQPQYLDVFRYATEQNPDDPNALLYYGNLLAGLGRLDEAVNAWEKSAALPGASSVTYRNLAAYAWKKQNDLPRAAELFVKAIAARPVDQTLYRDLAHVLIAQGKRDEAVMLIEDMELDHPRRGDITVILADTYNDLGRYDAALKLLEESQFSNWELNTASWRAFSRAHIERGKLRLQEGRHDDALADFNAALTYPENLGVGRPARPQESEALYWKGKALHALGRIADAKAAWQEGAAGEKATGVQNEFVEKCRDAMNTAD